MPDQLKPNPAPAPVYAGFDLAHGTENQINPIGDIYVGPSKIGRRGSLPGPQLKVLCDLPKRVPVLPEEIAIIEAYLADIINCIIANDN